MPTLSSLISNAVERLLFRPVTVTSSETIGNFQLVQLHGEGFSDVKWIPGQAVQFYLGNLTKRAYTPMDVDPGEGSARFLFYLHRGGPGSAWAAALKTGAICQVMRPKDSLDFTKIDGNAVFFGDETSLAAAQTLEHCRKKNAEHRYILEVTQLAAAERVAARLMLGNIAFVQRSSDGTHLEVVAEKLAQSASELRLPQWIFTGQARSIQTLRKNLRAAGSETPKSKVRAYWSPGKTGMD
jgi:ferric-chelate reductase (NADPH)